MLKKQWDSLFIFLVAIEKAFNILYNIFIM